MFHLLPFNVLLPHISIYFNIYWINWNTKCYKNPIWDLKIEFYEQSKVKIAIRPMCFCFETKYELIHILTIVTFKSNFMLFFFPPKRCTFGWNVVYIHISVDVLCGMQFQYQISFVTCTCIQNGKCETGQSWRNTQN